VRHAFDELNLDVLLAYYHPGNARSAALLQRAGFEIQSVVNEVPSEFRALLRPQVMAMLHAEAWRSRRKDVP
jgi:RimJ/RimL family protein N-acetyltransferase